MESPPDSMSSGNRKEITPTRCIVSPSGEKAKQKMSSVKKSEGSYRISRDHGSYQIFPGLCKVNLPVYPP